MQKAKEAKPKWDDLDKSLDALLPIFEESERQLILSLKSKTLKSLIEDMYKIYNKKGKDKNEF